MMEGGGGVTCDGLASHPGGVAIFPCSRLMLQKSELSDGQMGHLARKQTLPFYHYKTSYVLFDTTQASATYTRAIEFKIT